MLSAAFKKYSARSTAGVSTMARTYHTLESLAKTSPYTALMRPDEDVSTPDKVSVGASKTPRQLKSGFFTYTYPTERKAYEFLSSSTRALLDLDLDPNAEPKSQFFRDIVSGKSTYVSAKDGVHPFAMAYAGFQFGNFAGQLGDGRVVNLFTVKNPETGKSSSIREYVISESLNAIGIPSTRALAITALPENKAQRAGAEMCAVVCRMSPTWLRIGHFDYCRMKGDRKGLLELCDYINAEVLNGKKYTKELEDFIAKDEKLKKLKLTDYDKLFLDIVIRNAKSVAYWHSYGFLNGVLNTDNTSVLGLAIDFGPFAIMDKFDPNYTSNSEDHTLRYSFKNTPSAIWFNMVKLAESMAEILGASPELLKDENFKKNGFSDEKDIAAATTRVNSLVQAAGDVYEKVFIEDYLRLICGRLGITPKESDNSEILGLLFETLQVTKLEYNKFFTILQSLPLRDDDFDAGLAALAFLPESLQAPEQKEERDKVLKEIRVFLMIFRARVEEEFLTDEVRLERARGSNPLFTPKNWILDDVISYTTDKLREKAGEAEAGAYLNKIMKMANNPYDRSQWGEELKDVEERWMSDVDDSKMMLSCSCSS
ncbi:hypothetical protein PMKS-001503 [Pichia membranifaciens]|uniref:Selenoprotein O n=1 Tax=Pichia membranifaciens TaxID=4926 RepID=A0A1Q2YEV6_9ASCO|nr:hypothetical protein PMKS-001503 [Pichia membranifaciens]